jgi:hypothetical protein
MSSKTLRTVVGPGSVIQNSVGNLCGLTGAGGDLNCDLTGSLGCGVVFKLNTAGKETVLHRFGGSQADEGTPSGGLIRDNDGNLMKTIELQDSIMQDLSRRSCSQCATSMTVGSGCPFEATEVTNLTKPRRRPSARTSSYL